MRWGKEIPKSKREEIQGEEKISRALDKRKMK